MKQLFLTASANTVMDDLVKHLDKKPSEYNLVFIPTAAEGEEGDKWWLKADRDKLVEVGFKVTDFTVTGKNKDEIEKILDDKQIIFVSGGNSFYLLDQLIKSGAGEIIRRKVEEGVIYIGSSAGSVVVANRLDLVSELDDRSKAPELKSNGIGIIDINVQPHWGDESLRDGYKKGFDEMYTEGVKIVPLTNSQYLWVRDEDLRLIQV